MCGICGLAAPTATPVDRQVVKRMAAQIAHRGPDDAGDFFADGIGLGFQRLSIIDLTATGHQPMANADQTVWITFNGEIYNFQDLRQELTSQGATFKSQSDTEVILRGFEKHGPAWFERLAGMFAIALWDGRKHELHLVRDRFGKKPLFYSVANGHLYYASELQALRAVLPKPEIDPVALSHYFRSGFIPHPRTIYQGIQSLPPGHRAIWKNGQLEIQPFWKLRFEKTQISLEEAGAEFERRFRLAVQQRMISDVPLGVFLSGGLDSSIITALMAASSSAAVKTFSIGFSEASHNELPLAKLVAEKYQTEHHEFIVQPDVNGLLPKLMRHYGQPFGDSSALAVYAVAEQTRKFVTVALNGDGGDENFAGYDKYALLLTLQRSDLLPPPIRRALTIMAQPFLKLFPAARQHRLQVAGQFFQGDLFERYLDSQFVFSRSELSHLLTMSTPSDEKLENIARQRISDLPSSASLIDQITALDLRLYLPDGLMSKADISTMANSLEARSPFLDHRVVEFTASLPDDFKIRDGQRKYLLRRQFGHLLPAELLTAKKRGFDLPVNAWLKKELLATLKARLSDPTFRQLPYFNHPYIERLVREHETGRRHHGIRLWSLLCFAVWHKDVYQ